MKVRHVFHTFMKQVPEKFCDQAIFQSSLSPLPYMSRWFLAVGLAVVLGVAVNNEPSDDNYDLDTPEYGVANVSEDTAPVLPEVAEGDGMVAAEESMKGMKVYVRLQSCNPIPQILNPKS